jgi:hypothetical protein
MRSETAPYPCFCKCDPSFKYNIVAPCGCSTTSESEALLRRNVHQKRGNTSSARQQQYLEDFSMPNQYDRLLWRRLAQFRHQTGQPLHYCRHRFTARMCEFRALLPFCQLARQDLLDLGGAGRALQVTAGRRWTGREEKLFAVL